MAFQILLVNPPYPSARGYNREGRCTQEATFWSTPWPPLSLASIAAVLSPANSVRIIDCPAERVSAEKLVARVGRDRPDVVIAALSTETVESDLAVLAEIKAVLQTSAVVAFGIHASIFAGGILGDSPVDFIIRGEPEETSAELVTALWKHTPLQDVRGIAFRSQTGAVALTEKREFIGNLDGLPFPAWNLVDLGRYRLPISSEKFLIVNTSRGCPFTCVFCNAQAYYGSRLRTRSAENILAEIRTGIDRFGIRDYFFWGDTFTAAREQVKDLCARMIAEETNIRWVANSRVDTIDEEELSLMKTAGCWLLSYGLESGDDRILRECGKNITREKIRDAVRMTREAGLKIAGHFILGLPGETEETARGTIALARELDLDFAHFYSAVPYPGSRLFDIASGEGWIRGKSWARFRQTEFVMDLPTISAASLERFKRKAYRSLLLRPKTIKTVLSLFFSRFRNSRRGRKRRRS